MAAEPPAKPKAGEYLPATVINSALKAFGHFAPEARHAALKAATMHLHQIVDE